MFVTQSLHPCSAHLRKCLLLLPTLAVAVGMHLASSTNLVAQAAGTQPLAVQPFASQPPAGLVASAEPVPSVSSSEDASLPVASSSSSAAAALPEAPEMVSSGDPNLAQKSGHADDASTPQAGATSARPEDDQPDKRILGIIPNYRSVGVDAKLPPQSVSEKFKTSLQDTFDIGAFELAVVISLEEYATIATPEFGRGGLGYGRYFWHAFADQSIENESVEFVFPALTREDTRFYTLGRGGFAKRAAYSLTRIFIVRSDSGKETFNVGEIFGAGFAAGVSSLYYPQSQRTAGKVLSQYALNLGIDDASFFVREFDRDISNAFRLHRHAQPQP